MWVVRICGSTVQCRARQGFDVFAIIAIPLCQRQWPEAFVLIKDIKGATSQRSAGLFGKLNIRE